MGRLGFFRREKLGFEAAFQPGWIVAEPVNYDAYLFAPVVDGMWRQHETWDGTYSLEDLLDAHEMLAVRRENERRAEEPARIERAMQGR